MRVITRRATMLAGDRSRGAISPASVVASLVISRIVQQTSCRKGTVLPGRDTVTFIRLKVIKITMFFIRLSIKLHGEEI